MKHRSRLLFLCPVLFFFGNSLNAQKKFHSDTSYYETYFHDVTARVFVTQKYVDYKLPSNGGKDLEYHGNKKFNTGIGATWHNLTINVFYGFSFLNRDTAKGKTKGLDFQFHFYPRKWVIDVNALFPKGFFAFPRGYAMDDHSKFYTRSDVKGRMYGVNAYLVPNKEKFSYRAALNQNEWQKKSAGSFLFGGGVNYVSLEGIDSALVPSKVQSGFSQAGVTEMKYISIGPGVGYAYTLVLDRHFFITASLIGAFDVNISTEESGSAVSKKTTFGPSAIYKGAIGYNSSDWAVVASIAGNQFWASGPSTNKYSTVKTGVFRFAVSKKIFTKKHSM